MSDKPVQISLVLDNITPLDLINEHGFSVWIEANDQRILFDTGQGMALEHNAQRLGVDLSQATALVLSHGHYDHTWGLAHYLAFYTSSLKQKQKVFLQWF